jgi:hypothetical protein
VNVWRKLWGADGLGRTAREPVKLQTRANAGRPQVREVPVHLNSSSGLSVGELNSNQNTLFNLTGLVTPGAAVVGVTYENLVLSARSPSFGSEACMAFITDNRYAGVVCPSTLDAPGSQVRERPLLAGSVAKVPQQISLRPYSVVIKWRLPGEG